MASKTCCADDGTTITCDLTTSYGCICWSMPKEADSCECIGRERDFSGHNSKEMAMESKISIHLSGIPKAKLKEVLSYLTGTTLRQNHTDEDINIDVDQENVTVAKVLNDLGLSYST